MENCSVCIEVEAVYEIWRLLVATSYGLDTFNISFLNYLYYIIPK